MWVVLFMLVRFECFVLSIKLDFNLIYVCLVCVWDSCVGVGCFGFGCYAVYFVWVFTPYFVGLFKRGDYGYGFMVCDFDCVAM